MTTNPPRKHHFAPAFYLSRWAGGDGCLEQFNRPYGSIVLPRRLSPSATGFRTDLYAIDGLPADEAQQVEQKFMAPLDDLAAKVLSKLEIGEMPSSSADRSAWSRFLLSLQLRTPADIVAIKERIGLDWRRLLPTIEEAWTSLQTTSSSSFEEFLAKEHPLVVEQAAMKIATRMMDNRKIGQILINMHWTVLWLDRSNLSLLTSDGAMRQWLGLNDPRSLITLPIGPKRLFVAANSLSSIDGLQQINHRELVKTSNRAVVKLAREYVWGEDRRQETFVSNNFASVDAPTLGERLRAVSVSKEA